MPFSIKKKLLNVDRNTYEQVSKKLDILDSYLKTTYGKQIRDDSRLAYLWAIGENKSSMEDVAFEIKRMYYLYEETDYKQVSQEVVSKVSEELFNQYGLDEKTSSILSIRYMVPAVKAMYDTKNQDIDTLEDEKYVPDPISDPISDTISESTMDVDLKTSNLDEKSEICIEQVDIEEI